jgi:hypothetical protein
MRLNFLIMRWSLYLYDGESLHSFLSLVPSGQHPHEYLSSSFLNKGLGKTRNNNIIRVQQSETPFPRPLVVFDREYCDYEGQATRLPRQLVSQELPEHTPRSKILARYVRLYVRIWASNS